MLYLRSRRGRHDGLVWCEEFVGGGSGSRHSSASACSTRCCAMRARGSGSPRPSASGSPPRVFPYAWPVSFADLWMRLRRISRRSVDRLSGDPTACRCARRTPLPARPPWRCHQRGVPAARQPGRAREPHRGPGLPRRLSGHRRLRGGVPADRPCGTHAGLRRGTLPPRHDAGARQGVRGAVLAVRTPDECQCVSRSGPARQGRATRT